MPRAKRTATGGGSNGGVTGGEEQTQTHEHSFSHGEKKEPTCIDAGKAEYWYCAGCGKYYSDNAGNTEISDSALTLPATGLHRFTDNVCGDCKLEWIPTEGLAFSLDPQTDTYTVAGIGEASGNVVIPYYYEDKLVTAIAEQAFNGCAALTGIKIPDSVTDIGYEAFNACTKLVSVTLPNGITEISTGTFMQCKKLTAITIPDGVTAIRNSAFNKCNVLATVSLPESITVIEHDAFANCKALTSVTLPAKITAIESMTFSTCSALASVTIPAGVTSIGELAFTACRVLTDITFLGTEAQWEAIEKGENWDQNTGAYTVHYAQENTETE